MRRVQRKTDRSPVSRVREAEALGKVRAMRWTLVLLAAACGSSTTTAPTRPASPGDSSRPADPVTEAPPLATATELPKRHAQPAAALKDCGGSDKIEAEPDGL